MLTDYEGRPVPADEPDDAVIRVWVVSPHPGKPKSGYDLIERSWQRMLNYVRGELDCMLEHYEMDELEEEPVTLKFSLQLMTKREYLEIIEPE